MGSALSAVVAFVILVGLVGTMFLAASSGSAEVPEPEGSRLAVVWTSGDPEVAHRMCLMYAHAARKAGWFDHVLLVVWGPSGRLLVADKDLKAKVKAMMADGVQVQACVACADMYGISEDLRALGIEVKGMGKPLTDMLRSDWKVITF